MSFEYLGLSDEVLKAVADAGYTEPTPIQRQAIPAVLQGRDIMGIAQTGTGKTASFTLPMLDILSAGRARARMSRSLIIEPTRELAAQVAENFAIYGKNSALSMALLIGGVSFDEQLRNLDRGVDVLIATPGRLLDHFERGKLMLNGVEILVVDEADRMLDMGFIPDVERICSLITARHQTLFFSATMPAEIRRLSNRFLTEPREIQVSRPASTLETTAQKLLIARPRQKGKALSNLLKTEKIANAIVFCNRKRDADSVAKRLAADGVSVRALHGDMNQFSRMEVLADFKANKIQILVASDVAARGLDIPAVSHVFNYDVPTHAEDYVHRIGRTGRAGREGTAITIALPDDGRYIADIEKLTGRKMERIGEGQTDAPALEEAAPRRGRRGGGRKRAPDKKAAGAEKTVAPAKDRTAETAKSGKAAKPADKAPDRARKAPRDNRRQRSEHGRRAPNYPSANAGFGVHVPAFFGAADNRPKAAEDSGQSDPDSGDSGASND